MGTVNIWNQIDTGYKLGIKRHNGQVFKNRDILEKILNCVECSGNYKLSWWKSYIKNQGVFRGWEVPCVKRDSMLWLC